MSEHTRDKLIATSIQIMSVKGFNNTGIAEILTQVGVPKGSFYHYFKSKDDLGLAIIEHYGNNLSTGLSSYLAAAEGKAILRLRGYFEMALGFFEGNFTSCNCLLGNLAQELAMQSPKMRDAIFTHYLAVEKIIANCLGEAKQQGDLAANADEQVLARLLFSSWEGCLVRAKLEQSPAALVQLLDMFFNQLAKPS